MQMPMSPRALIVALCLLPALVAGLGRAQASVEIQEVTSESGVKAWLVEDYSIPLIAINFAFRGGTTQDPSGKEGLAYLMSGLFDEGAGDLDSDAFQEAIDDSAAEMQFTATRDAVYGSVRLLADERDEALGLLALAINKPRFDPAPFERIRAQIIASIKSRERDPKTQAEEIWAKRLYGEHPYANRNRGTEESLIGITTADVAGFHSRIFARSNLHVSIVGAIDAESARKVLDRLFGDLPAEAELLPVENAMLKFGEEISISYQLPQASIRMAWPGVERDDPDFFAAYVMNHVLGGGSFSSRLYHEIREKRGLAYGVNSALVNLDHASGLVLSTATRSDRATETLQVIRSVVSDMADNGPTEAELEAAKGTIIGGYAVNNLSSSAAVASTLVELQLSDLGIDYIDRRASLIDAVTLEDAKRVATEIFKAEPSIMVVGPEGIFKE